MHHIEMAGNTAHGIILGKRRQHFVIGERAGFMAGHTAVPQGKMFVMADNHADGFQLFRQGVIRHDIEVVDSLVAGKAVDCAWPLRRVGVFGGKG